MITNKLFSIKVVGAFDLLDRDGHSVRPSIRKDCAIIAILALTPNHRQTRTWLQDKLWGDREPTQGAASLRQSLSTIRSILNCGEDVLSADRTWVWLNPEKLNFDHTAIGTEGEILRGFDLRDEGFNDWLREARASFEAAKFRWGPVCTPVQSNRYWHLDVADSQIGAGDLSEICNIVCDGLAEALSVMGVQTIVDRRASPTSPDPRATDLVVRMRTVSLETGCILSLVVTDGFGTLHWQIRREANTTKWSEICHLIVEMTQQFQDFVIRTEAKSLQGTRWSAHSNGCQALMGILAPGSVPLREIAHCSAAAIAADGKGIYHALLGFSQLLLFGERESPEELDADVVMQNFRTALQISPSNGLVQALAGHSHGFFLHELDRNAEMTSEAVRLLPGSGACHIFRAISLVYCGQYAEAVKTSVRSVLFCNGTLAQPMARSVELFARLMAGDNDGAIKAGEKSLEAILFRPTIVDLMAAYTRAGRICDGQKKLRLLVNREPNLSTELIKSNDYPIVNPTHRVVIADAARQLGLA